MPQMKELYAKVAADVTLQEKFTEVIKNVEAAGKEETDAKLVAFAKEAGYDVTPEEMKTFFANQSKDRELSDADLEMVAGGKQNPLQWVDNMTEKAVDFGNDINNRYYIPIDKVR